MGLKRRLEDARARLDEQAPLDAARDEREEEHRAVIDRMNETDEGRDAVAQLGEIYIEHGGDVLTALRTEGGRAVARSFRDRFFEAAERVRNEREAKLGGDG